MEINIEQAQDLYLNKEYDLAAESYDEIYELDTSNPYPLINAANSYYQIEQYGTALGKYYKAKSIIPRNKELNNNLVIVTNDIKLSQPPMLAYSFMTWTEAFMIFLVFNILFLVKKKISKLKTLSFLISFLFLVSGLNFAFITYEQKVKKHGVVNTVSTKARSGDDEAYTELFELYDGQIVDIISQEKQWSKIKHQGSLGWVENQNLEAI